MMTNNKENLLMDRDKQYTPLEREVSPKDAFTAELHLGATETLPYL